MNWEKTSKWAIESGRYRISKAHGRTIENEQRTYYTLFENDGGSWVRLQRFDTAQQAKDAAEALSGGKINQPGDYEK